MGCKKKRGGGGQRRRMEEIVSLNIALRTVEEEG